MNIMTIDGHQAVITYDPDTDRLRGEFLGLNGGADFVATTIPGLRREGKISLRVFLEACAEQGLEPFKSFSGKFMARVKPELHQRAIVAAAAKGISLNQLVERAIEHEVSA